MDTVRALRLVSADYLLLADHGQSGNNRIGLSLSGLEVELSEKCGVRLGPIIAKTFVYATLILDRNPLRFQIPGTNK